MFFHERIRLKTFCLCRKRTRKSRAPKKRRIILSPQKALLSSRASRLAGLCCGRNLAKMRGCATKASARGVRMRIEIAQVRWPNRQLWLLLAALALLPASCKKIQQDRAISAEMQAATTAIAAYSKASDDANQAHRDVLKAFDDANHCSNLPGYKNALRSQVLPAMDAFLAKLRQMPTGTAELKVIHGTLVGAYETARSEIGRFEADLTGSEGLGQFAAIRNKLQAGVKLYREQLDKYYGKFERKLRLEGPTPLAAAATPTTTAPSASAAPTPLSDGISATEGVP